MLELLHDTSFHSLPMVNSRQNISVFETQDKSKFTFPFFDVQGPIMTLWINESNVSGVGIIMVMKQTQNRYQEMHKFTAEKKRYKTSSVLS